MVKRTIQHYSIGLLVGGGVGMVGEFVVSHLSPRIWIWISIFALGIMGMFISHFWNQIAPRIPYERIRQDVEPQKWIFSEIISLDMSNLLMYGQVRNLVNVGCVYLTVNIKSQLKFDVVFVILGGFAVVNQETIPELYLDNQSDIKLSKNSDVSLEQWPLNIRSRVAEAALNGGIIQLRINGIDSKGRHYKFITKEYKI